MSFTTRSLCSCFAILVISASSFATVPQSINYQGYLTASNGTSLDTTVAMTFRIYGMASGGNMLWMETHPSVVVAKGLFQVRLGSVTTLSDLFSDNRWLEIQIGSDLEMTPREQIVSVAHAYRVGTVDAATGGTISGDINITGKANIGSGNTNPGTYAFVVGQDNDVAGTNAAVGGGRYNHASGNYSAIGGGGGATAADSNSATGECSVVGGGAKNIATTIWATVGGGYNNDATGISATVGGGYGNHATGPRATVGGGVYNVADTSYTTVSGGTHNHATGEHATVGGGDSNVASGCAAMVAGGTYNTASGDSATVGGGHNNSATGRYSAAAGGCNNGAWSDYATVGGGYLNDASGYGSTVGGGAYNGAEGGTSTVGGGTENWAPGESATVPGGFSNTASGDYSFAAGRSATASGDGVFAWADATGSTFGIGSANTFNARASGGVRFWTTSDITQNIGARLPAGSSTWTTLSDSTKKQNIRLVDSESVLDKVLQLPIKQWSYISQDPSIEHIGPMAQDFWNAFHVGDDSLSISTIDPSGVALAAIQELIKQNQQLESRVEDLEAALLQLGLNESDKLK